MIDMQQKKVGNATCQSKIIFVAIATYCTLLKILYTHSIIFGADSLDYFPICIKIEINFKTRACLRLVH